MVPITQRPRAQDPPRANETMDHADPSSSRVLQAARHQHGAIAAPGSWAVENAMRHAAILTFVLMTGCATEPDPATSTAASDLDCGSFCDPGDPINLLGELDLVSTYIGATFRGSVIVDAPACVSLGTDQAPEFECSQQIYIAQNPCGPVAVYCHRSHCSYQLLNYCH